ncbi:unnamed protein product [Boreogadus saida]
MSAEEEGYPAEIQEQLTGFESSVGVINSMLQTMVSMPRNDLLQKLDPLDQAKLDLMSAYTLNSLFWMYLVTRGQNPREHGVKQELERIRGVMTRVKDITDRKKAARLDKVAAARFLRRALYDAKEGRDKRPTPGRAPKTPTPQTGHAPKTPTPQTGHGPKTPTSQKGHGPKTPTSQKGHGPKTPTPQTGHAPKTPTPQTGHGPKTPTSQKGHGPKTPTPQTGRAPKTPTPQTGRAPMTPTPTKKPRKN